MSKIELHTAISFLDGILSVNSIPDAPRALNGLQLENGGTVSKVAAAVDGSEKAIHAALETGADLLLLHHGIFWQPMQPITGIAYRKLKAAMDGNLAIYAAHLPLDVHPAYGNNACWRRPRLRHVPMMGWTTAAFPSVRTENFQVHARNWSKNWKPSSGAPVQAFWKDSPEAPAGDVFICTGGAGDDLAQAAALGCRTYVTGEGSHWNIPLAQELGVNLVFGGHYFTETFGVKALGLLLKDVYGLDYTFIDLPPSAYSH